MRILLIIILSAFSAAGQNHSSSYGQKSNEAKFNPETQVNLKEVQRPAYKQRPNNYSKQITETRRAYKPGYNKHTTKTKKRKWSN